MLCVCVRVCACSGVYVLCVCVCVCACSGVYVLCVRVWGVNKRGAIRGDHLRVCTLSTKTSEPNEYHYSSALTTTIITWVVNMLNIKRFIEPGRQESL